MLYRDLAPVTQKTWDEIDERAKEVLINYLSARKVVNVNGPKGLDFNVISEGRLTNILNDGNIFHGIYKVLPLTETRIEFEMNRWELDNIERGAKDVDYEPLEKAMKELAIFEERAIYQALKDELVLEEIAFGKDAKGIMEAITKGLVELRKNFIKGSLALVVNEEAYKRILSKETGYPLDKRIEELIDGKIVFSHVVDGAYLLPYDNENLELTIGRDFSIGYHGYDMKKVRFFATESFAFRVLDPSIIVKYKL